MSYHQDLQKAERIQEELQREEELVRDMQAFHQKQIKEQKLRQSIKESSAELRELEQKLNYAYMNKERALQLQEKALLAEKAAVFNYLSELIFSGRRYCCIRKLESTGRAN